MQIQGTLTVEGVALHVHIDAPDEARELYITNIPPNALLIPRERVRIEWLGLPPDKVQNLHEKGIHSLGQLVNEHWQLSSKRLDDEDHAVVTQALKSFLDAALVFDFPEDTPTYEVLAESQQRLEALCEALDPKEIRVSDEEEKPEIVVEGFSPPIPISDNGVSHQDIKVLGLPAGVTRELRTALGIHQLHEFDRHTREEVFSLKYLDNEKMQERLVEQLRLNGVELPTGILDWQRS